MCDFQIVLHAEQSGNHQKAGHTVHSKESDDWVRKLKGPTKRSEDFTRLSHDEIQSVTEINDRKV